MRDEYVCSNYRQRTRECTMHYIKAPAVEELVLAAIRRASEFARENESEFAEKIRQATDTRQEESAREAKKRLVIAKRRRDELDGFIKKLYETYAAGKLPGSQFERLVAGYDSEQKTLDTDIEKTTAEIQGWDAENLRADGFLELARRYTEFTELTTAMLNEFVDKIVVHEADKSSGKRVQKVDIYFNFIGHFVPPFEEKEPTPEEIAAYEKRERWLAKNRIRQRQYRERKKLKEQMGKEIRQTPAVA
jgi:hypothetical protein